MAARKPNNLPWIVLGSVLGAGLVVLFGYGFWQGVKAERGIILSSPPPATTDPAANSKVITIFVDETNALSVDGKNVSSTAELLRSVEMLDVDDTVVILRLSEQAQHSILVDIKDGLDKLGIHTKIEIIRTGQ